MSDTFLVGVDGSEGSLRAARFAIDRAKRMDAHLLVVFVIEWSPYSFNTPEENEQRHKRREQEIDAATNKVLNPLLEKIRDSGVETEGVVYHGNISEVMIRIAKEVNATGMFIGRLGSASLKSRLFGSVTSNLVQMSPIPVTVVP
jgi:nucleotide-binding universal stress UspA family protein